MKPRLSRTLASACMVISFTSAVHAAIRTKADNTQDLGQAGSWGGTAPGAADTANWSGTYNTTGSLAAPLPGSALSWQGITVGSLTGGAAGTVSIGGTEAPVAASGLAIGSSGINLTSASHDLVINAETFNIAASQNWTIPPGRNLRFGAGVATANVTGAGGDATVVTITGGGTVDGNQEGLNGFSGYTGKWVVGPNTMLRGMGTGTAAWGSNTAADAITLNGGTLAYGAISGVAGKVSWSSPITLGAATSSTISSQHLGTGTPELTLQGAISGDGNLVIDKAVGKPFILKIDRADNTQTGWTSIASGTSGGIAVSAHLGTAGGTKTPFGTGDITVTGASASAAALEFTTDAVSTPSDAESVIANNINLNNATLRTREGLVNFTGTLYLTGANVIQGYVNLKDIIVDGLIDGPGSVTLRGTGSQQFRLPAANSYSGGTILGQGSANVGAILLGDPDALGSGPVTARGLQIRSSVPDLVLSNTVLVGGGSGGGLCFGGENNISLEGPITVTDNSSRPFQNSGAGVVTLAGIALDGGTGATAAFGSGSAQGEFVVSGPVTGAGKITLSGGQLTLAGNSTYTGTTTVSGLGRLHLTGTLTSAITMTGAGASLTGNGFTSGNLTTTGAGGAGIFYLDPANPTAAITATDVAFNGPTKVELLSQQPLGTTSYTVLNYTGTLTGLGNLSSSQTRGVFTNDTINKRVVFSATTATRTWTGAASTVWNTTDLNWAEGDKLFFGGDAAVFGNTGAGALAIAGVVSPSLTTFANAAGNDWTLTTGPGNQIGGPGGLVKSGTGTVTLVGPNTFTGATTLAAGTLAIRVDTALGAPPAEPVPNQLTLTGGTLKLEPATPADFALHPNRGISLAAGVSTIDTTGVGNGATATVAGEIEGAGNLVLLANGDTSLTGGGVPGSTYLSGFNLQTGSTTIKSGVVAIESGFGDPEAVVILDGGGLVDRNINAYFTYPLQAGPAGGILRSYGNATTTFTGPIGNAPGVVNATLTHTDGGLQIFSGDGSAYQGTYLNARGGARFESADWQQTAVVNVDGGPLGFGLVETVAIKSLTTDRDVLIEAGTALDIVSGSFNAASGEVAESFAVQGEGVLTSSSGTLTFDFPVSFETAIQSVSVLIDEPLLGPPLTVVKNGIGGIANFNQPNNHTGGTVINGGRITATHQDAFGWGPVTVNPGGQAYLAAPNGFYPNDMTAAGIGPAEAAGNLGAIRFDANATTNGLITVAPAGARFVTHNGATGTISGPLAGSGNLELNSPTALHNGTFVLSGDAFDYTGTLTVAQGRLNLASFDFGGSIVVRDGASIGGEGVTGGSLTLGASTGAILRVDGSTTEALTAGSLVLNGATKVSLDLLPPDENPITIVNYTSLSGSVANLETAGTSLRRLAFTDTGSSITAVITTASRTWSGAVSGTWDSATPNWVEEDQRFYAGDAVTFPGGAANRAITIASSVSPASLLFDNSTGNDYSVAGRMVIGAGGSFVKQGGGALTLTGTPSSIAVPLVLNGGLVTVGTTDYARAFGPAPEIIVNAGTLRLNGINLLYDGGGAHTITVNPGAAVELNGYHNHFRTLNLNGATVRGITSNDPGARYNDEYSTFDSPVNVGGTQLSVITRAVGGTGTFSLGGAVFNVADVATGTDLLVDAPLVGGTLTKNDAGTMALTQPGTYAGGTVINGGTLLANNTNGSATGAGAIIVNAGGTLGGTGAVGGAVGVEPGGSLAPGGEGIESLATGALNLKTGATLRAEINSASPPAADVLAASGNVTLAGSLSLGDLAGTPAVIPGGTRLTLLTYSGTLTGTFAGLAEGATITLAPNSFRIRYNDAKKVTLESLAAAAGYDAWAAAKITNGLTGRNQDADGDRLTNLQEFLFGTDPMVNTGSLTTSEIVGSSLILRWLQRESGASYTLKESITLAAGSWATSPLIPAPDPNQAGVPAAYDRYRVVIPLGAVPKKFFRVEGVEN